MRGVAGSSTELSDIEEEPCSADDEEDSSSTDDEMFQRVGINAKEKTHSARKQSVKHTELRGVLKAQIRRARRRNTRRDDGSLPQLSALRFYAVNRGLSATRQRLFPPLRAGDTRRGPLYANLARNSRLARAYGSLPPRPNRQRGRTARSRGFGIPAPLTYAPGHSTAGFRGSTPVIPAPSSLGGPSV